ncbi:LytR family transcriptional regulator [Streptococcus dentapri]|uniref:LytR family transcriptional regulator n=1 Tax=Streptococcus dentapri TaxID=573564 RepID=A0ABV8D0T3_9STRE
MDSPSLKERLEVLLKHYDYASAYRVIDQHDISEDAKRLILLMKKRRQLAIEELFELSLTQHFQKTYQCRLTANPPAEELLANYIMDLQAKVLTEDIIDFVRAVSPIIYRLFMRLIAKEIPDIEDYMTDAKGAQYDTWKFDKMAIAPYPALKSFVQIWHDPRVTSRSLASLISQLAISESLKKDVSFLRDMEKSVRNPLAHLIRPFDEKILHQTTGFSSRSFLEMIIKLARYTGVVYHEHSFYFDQMNQLIISLL